MMSQSLVLAKKPHIVIGKTVTELSTFRSSSAGVIKVLFSRTTKFFCNLCSYTWQVDRPLGEHQGLLLTSSQVSGHGRSRQNPQHGL